MQREDTARAMAGAATREISLLSAKAAKSDEAAAKRVRARVVQEQQRLAEVAQLLVGEEEQLTVRVRVDIISHARIKYSNM